MVAFVPFTILKMKKNALSDSEKRLLKRKSQGPDIKKNVT